MMECNIEVSILMPIYKVEQYLEKALDSIFTQTYKDINYVFVDDCSPDASLQVLLSMISRYRIDTNRYTIINHAHNEGVAASRADCIANAKGDYILFVDSDDWIEKDAVEEMVAATKGGTIDIVGCDYMKDFLSGKTTYHRENYAETCRDNLYRCLNYDIATVLWKLLIRRSLFDNFHISPINIGEDYIMSIKLFYYASSFSILRKAFYHYVQYNQNRLSFQLLCSINDHIKCVNEVERFFRDNKMYDGVVEHQLLLRKFNIKSNFILNRKLFNPDVFINIFPESKGIWKEMNYSKKERFEFWLAEHNFLLLLNLLKK